MPSEALAVASTVGVGHRLGFWACGTVQVPYTILGEIFRLCVGWTQCCARCCLRLQPFGVGQFQAHGWE